MSSNTNSNKKIDKITGLPYSFIGSSSDDVAKDWIHTLQLCKVKRKKYNTILVGDLSEAAERSIKSAISVGGHRDANGNLNLQGNLIYVLKKLLIEMKLSNEGLIISRFD